MNKIVFPTDFSENSVKALEFALKYLSKPETEFIITNVYQIPSGNVSGTFYLLEELKKQAENDMKSFMASLEEKYPNVKVTSKVLQGDFDSQCNAVAIQYQADCIIMGTKGASGIKEALIGSNTASLMKGLKAPLFVIPFEALESPINQFIFSYDGTELTDRANQEIEKFANWFQLPAKAIHVSTTQEEEVKNWDAVSKLFSKLEFSHKEVHADDFELGLKQTIENKKGILCMVRHKKSFWENLFKQSDSRKAVMHAHIPVLVIPE